MQQEKTIVDIVDPSDASIPADALPDGRTRTTAPQAQDNSGAVEHNNHGNIVSVVAAIAANILVGIVKFIAAGISGSSAMISEGIHSIVDSGNGLLVLLGIKRSSKKPSPEHPFGYGSELYFWTMIVAVMIFALGGGFSIYEGVTHILDISEAESLGNPVMSYIVLVLAACIEGTSLMVAIKNFNRARGDIKPFQFIREAKDPSLYTVVLEDSAAELGLLFAFFGLTLTLVTGIPYFDGAASVMIGLLLCGVSTILLRETKGLLIGEGLKLSELDKVERIVEREASVVECGRILTLYLGPNDLLVAIDVTFARDASRDDIVSSIDNIERGIVAEFPQTNRIFIETESLRYTRTQARERDRLEQEYQENGSLS